MSHSIRTGFCLLAVVLACGGCASAPKVERIDLTDVAGVLVVVWDARADVRVALENQLVADLAARSLVAYPSHADLPDILGSSPEAVVGAGNARRVAAVLVVNQVHPAPDARAGAAPARVSPEHQDLQTFFAFARAQAPAPVDPAHEAIAEVNLFLLQGGEARRFWSGVALTGVADGSGAGLRDLSGQIADALARAQRELRGG